MASRNSGTTSWPAFIAWSLAATICGQVLVASTASACDCMVPINAGNACVQSPFAFMGRVTNVESDGDGFDITLAVLESFAGDVPATMGFRIGPRRGEDRTNCDLRRPFPEGSVLRIFLVDERRRKIGLCTYVEVVNEHDIAKKRCDGRANMKREPNDRGGCAPCSVRGPGGWKR